MHALLVDGCLAMTHRRRKSFAGSDRSATGAYRLKPRPDKILAPTTAFICKTSIASTLLADQDTRAVATI